jgi:hypothetical protein
MGDLSGYPAIFDSGTSFVSGPEEWYHNLVGVLKTAFGPLPGAAILLIGMLQMIDLI